jgi:hypothetical protein
MRIAVLLQDESATLSARADSSTRGRAVAASRLPGTGAWATGDSSPPDVTATRSSDPPLPKGAAVSGHSCCGCSNSAGMSFTRPGVTGSLTRRLASTNLCASMTATAASGALWVCAPLEEGVILAPEGGRGRLA